MGQCADRDESAQSFPPGVTPLRPPSSNNDGNWDSFFGCAGGEEVHDSFPPTQTPCSEPSDNLSLPTTGRFSLTLSTCARGPGGEGAWPLRRYFLSRAYSEGWDIEQPPAGYSIETLQGRSVSLRQSGAPERTPRFCGVRVYVHESSGIGVWIQALDLSDPGGDRSAGFMEVLFRYVEADVLMAISESPVLSIELWEALTDTRALFGTGVYTTRLEPAQLSRPTPRTRHSGKWPRVCCVAIIVPERMAYQVSVRATPEMTHGPGRDINGRPTDPDCDLWVIRCPRGPAHVVANAAANAELRWRQIVLSLEEVHTPLHEETSKAAVQLSDVLWARGKHHEAELVLTRTSDGRSAWRSTEMSGASTSNAEPLVSSRGGQFPEIRITPPAREQHEEMAFGPSSEMRDPRQIPKKAGPKFRADPFGEGNALVRPHSPRSSVSQMIIKFKSCNGDLFNIFFVRQPLGIDFDRSSPLVVKGIFPGSHAELMKVEVGWAVAGVDSESMIGREFNYVFSRLVSAESALAREVHVEGIVPNLANWRSELIHMASGDTKYAHLSSGATIPTALESNSVPESVATLPPGSNYAHQATTPRQWGTAAMARRCIGGHGLKMLKAYTWGVCDMCGGSVSQGDAVAECSVCSPIWWMCVTCCNGDLDAWKMLDENVVG